MQTLTAFRSLPQAQRPLPGGRSGGNAVLAQRSGPANTAPRPTDLNPPTWEELLGHR
jgi:hypothetical protein